MRLLLAPAKNSHCHALFLICNFCCVFFLFSSHFPNLIDVDSVVKQPPQLDRKHRKKFFRRRNSTGSVGVMNSHAFNLQTTGHQAVVVGHHRGFSQPSSANTGDPWFLQKSHEMPPTAPARQHKRPAPQPGILLHSNGQTNHLSHHSQVTVRIL